MDEFLIYEKKILINNQWKYDFFPIAQVIPGLLVLLIGYLGCNIIIVLIVWFIAVTLITAAYAGAMANIVDIAPNLAGPVLAFAQTIHMTASFLSPAAAAIFTDEDVRIIYYTYYFKLRSNPGQKKKLYFRVIWKFKIKQV